MKIDQILLSLLCISGFVQASDANKENDFMSPRPQPRALEFHRRQHIRQQGPASSSQPTVNFEQQRLTPAQEVMIERILPLRFSTVTWSNSPDFFARLQSYEDQRLREAQERAQFVEVFEPTEDIVYASERSRNQTPYNIGAITVPLGRPIQRGIQTQNDDESYLQQQVPSLPFPSRRE